MGRIGTDRSRTSSGAPVASRRQALKSLAISPLALPSLARQLLGTPSPPGRSSLQPQVENSLLRMQRELQESLRKPVAERNWIMVIDLRKCVGCWACTTACKVENHLPPGVSYRPLAEAEIGTYPEVRATFMPWPCMHCDNPPCIPACPRQALYKRPDGIVAINYDACDGCRDCLAACIYTALSYDGGADYSDGTPESPQPYEERPSFEYGRRWTRDAYQGIVRKCHWCLHRLEAGMLPACVSTCIGQATFFGDKNDPESLVNELLSTRSSLRLKENRGTEPRVYYLL